MSDRLQDSSKTIASVTEDLTADMSVAAVSGRLFAKLVNAMDARKPGSVPVKPKGAPKKTPGLSPRPPGQHGRRNGYLTHAADQ